MGYYRGAGMGDFYRGARGDPGFWSFLGGAAKTLSGFIPGVGPLISGGIDAITKGVGAKVAAKSGAIIAKGSAIVKAHPVLTAAGAAGVAGAGAGLVAGKMGGTPAAARMGGARGAGGGGRRRRMRVTNPKALRRAIRRTTGFAKLAMRTIHLVHPKKKAKFGGFRRKRAKK
jgi:hypothetical protein